MEKVLSKVQRRRPSSSTDLNQPGLKIERAACAARVAAEFRIQCENAASQTGKARVISRDDRDRATLAISLSRLVRNENAARYVDQRCAHQIGVVGSDRNLATAREDRLIHRRAALGTVVRDESCCGKNCAFPQNEHPATRHRQWEWRTARGTGTGIVRR